MLHYIAVHPITLYHLTLHHIISHYIALCYITLHHITSLYVTLPSIAVSFVSSINIYLDANTNDIHTKFSRNLKNTLKTHFSCCSSK